MSLKGNTKLWGHFTHISRVGLLLHPTLPSTYSLPCCCPIGQPLFPSFSLLLPIIPFPLISTIQRITACFAKKMRGEPITYINRTFWNHVSSDVGLVSPCSHIVPSVISLLVPLMNYCEDYPWPPQVSPMSRFYLTSLCRFASPSLTAPSPSPLSQERVVPLFTSQPCHPLSSFSVCACLLFLVCKYERDVFPLLDYKLKECQELFKNSPLSWYLNYSLITIFFNE